MIKIGRFEIGNDGSGWILWEIGTAKDRQTKQLKEKRRPRYYATVAQCCNKIIDLSAQHAETASEVVEAVEKAKADILKAIEGAKK